MLGFCFLISVKGNTGGLVLILEFVLDFCIFWGDRVDILTVLSLFVYN